MRCYPALTQFPLEKRCRQRTVENRMEDARSVRWADTGGGATRWRLWYTALSDAEAEELEAFFADCEGQAETFTFLDPTANLLSRSEELQDAVWEKDPLLVVESEGAAGWRVINNGAAAQGLRQTLEAPGWYPYCLSVWARSAAAGQVTLVRGGTRETRDVAPEWRRLVSAGQEQTAAETVAFGIELPPGATVEIFGLQAEAQRTPSAYRPGAGGGVCSGARFASDVLTVTADAPGQHSCIVEIVHADHL